MNKPRKKTRLTPPLLQKRIEKLKERLALQDRTLEEVRALLDSKKVEVDRLLKSVETAYNAGTEFQKKIAQLEREKANVWENLGKAEAQIVPMRELLEFCFTCLDDFQNRHLVVCHQCESDEFRFKSISIASDFKRLLTHLAPYRKGRTTLDFVRMPEPQRQ